VLNAKGFFVNQTEKNFHCGIRVEEFGDQCWVYGSDIPHGDRLYGAVDVFLKRKDISEESKRKLLVDNTARFYGLDKKAETL
jgi:predicted TIM-barrel fold metal-dependent hydrolase